MFNPDDPDAYKHLMMLIGEIFVPEHTFGLGIYVIW